MLIISRFLRCFLLLGGGCITGMPIEGGVFIEKVVNFNYDYVVSLQRIMLQSRKKSSNNYSGLFEHFCGGSLISRQWILTAAHCVWKKNPTEIMAVVGKTNVNRVDDNDLKPIEHIEYIDYESTRLLNDIALLKLSHAYDIETNFIEDYLQIPSHNLKLATKNACFVVGYGVTGSLAGEMENRLNVAEVYEITNDECSRYLSALWTPQAGENRICAINRDQDSCEGDSGGPLLCPRPGKGFENSYYLYGIISYGMTCGLIEAPSVYTLTGPYAQWINEIMQRRDAE